MGRLGKSSEPNAQYTKLTDNYSSSCESPPLLGVGMSPDFQGYVSFSCRHCGHLQLFQGAELEMILGKSLKMAFRSNRNREDTQQNNIPMSTYPKATFQESSDGSSIGIPVASSDEANSPTQLNQFKRHADKPSLMKRIGKGLTLATSDEEGYPLVSEGSSSIPGSQSNISSLNASEASTLRVGDATALPKPETAELSKKETNLKMAPWYQEGIPREIALEVLSQEPIGSFMVRRSTTKLGCFALSVRVPRSFQPKGIAHYLIMRTAKGYRIKGFTKDFPTLASLIAHHSIMPELLPCPLSLNRYHPVCVISDCRRDFADIEPEPDG